MSSTIFSVKCSLVYLCVTGNNRPYVKVLTVTRPPSLIFWRLKVSFSVIVPTVGKDFDPVKKNKRSSKSKVTSFLALLEICCIDLRIALRNLPNMMLTLPPIVHLRWPPDFPLFQNRNISKWNSQCRSCNIIW